MQERGIGHPDDERLVPALAQSLREQQHLSLPATPFAAGVDM